MSKNPPKPDLLTSLRILNQIGASILNETTIAAIVDQVYHHVNELMDAYSFAIGVYNASTGKIEYTGTRENKKILPFFSIDANSSEKFSGWVFANKAPILINDFNKEVHHYLPKAITPMHGIEPASLMYVPIFTDQNIAGILSVRTPHKNAYNEQTLEILKTLSVFIARAFENTRNATEHQHRKKPLPKHYLLDPLSARELEVLNLLSKGLSNRSIADALFISASTVKTHTLNIYEKLEADNRTQAIIHAKEYGLIM